MTSPFSQAELEPPAWLYVLMARGPLWGLMYRRFVSDLKVSLPQAALLLDVGTGPGYLLTDLARSRPDLALTGVDLSLSMLTRGRRRGRENAPGADISLVAGDSQALPFKGGTFDQVLVTFSLHIWPAPGLGVAEISRVLKAGGRAWLYEMRRETPSASLRAFAREESLPFPLVFLLFKFLSRYHGLWEKDFAAILSETPGIPWLLKPVHHILWRLEVGQAA